MTYPIYLVYIPVLSHQSYHAQARSPDVKQVILIQLMDRKHRKVDPRQDSYVPVFLQ